MSTPRAEAILQLAQRGPIRTRDLDRLGVPRVYLRRLCDRGLLEQVDRGIYRLAGAPVTDFHSLVQIAKRVSHAVVCLLSALQFHGLTSEVPHAVWAMIEGHARAPKVTTPKRRDRSTERIGTTVTPGLAAGSSTCVVPVPSTSEQVTSQ